MIHGVRIKDGKATYVSRYVKTSRLKQEEFFGAAKFMKVWDLVFIYIYTYHLWDHFVFFYFLQIGDLKGFLGLLMVYLQQLRTKLNVLDVSYGHGTGWLLASSLLLSLLAPIFPLILSLFQFLNLCLMFITVIAFICLLFQVVLLLGFLY